MVIFNKSSLDNANILFELVYENETTSHSTSLHLTILITFDLTMIIYKSSDKTLPPYFARKDLSQCLNFDTKK